LDKIGYGFYVFVFNGVVLSFVLIQKKERNLPAGRQGKIKTNPNAPRVLPS
jgi:hypothetical protein